MEIDIGNKKILHNTKMSIIDIKLDDGYNIYVFKGSLSKNDILIKYSLGGGRSRTPKHIHWVIDILLKEQKNKNQMKSFVKCISDFWDNTNGLQNTNYSNIKQVLENSYKKIYNNVKKFKLDGGEYSLEFLVVLLILLILQEKTNKTDAHFFKDILDSLLKERLDIFNIVSKATYKGK